MRQILWLGLVAIFIGMYGTFRSKSAKGPKHVHVILVGASIGQAWHLADWPARMRAPAFSAESVAVWRFDKSEAIGEVFTRPARKPGFTRNYFRSLFYPPPKPDVVILKECSSYFPGDLGAYQDMVKRWVHELRANRLKVILATVVPVTRNRGAHDHGKQESLSEYNRWVRKYSAEQDIPVLDLDAALRVGEAGSFLRDEFAAEDGSHLIPPAYAVLDRTLLTALCGSTFAAACAPTERGVSQ